LLRVLQWRRDVRHFETRPVEQSLITHLIETTRLAPSVGFSQPWRFVLVQSSEARQKIRANFETENAAAAAEFQGTAQQEYQRLKLAGLDRAPVQLAVFVDTATERGRGLGRRTMPETLAYSAVMAIHTLWLTATAHGLGVGWVSILDPTAVERSLDVPAEWSLVAFLCVGYPERPSTTPELQERGWETPDDRAHTLFVR
jgi:5,6-dimethylbenzimidazole synthase